MLSCSTRNRWCRHRAISAWIEVDYGNIRDSITCPVAMPLDVHTRLGRSLALDGRYARQARRGARAVQRGRPDARAHARRVRVAAGACARAAARRRSAQLPHAARAAGSPRCRRSGRDRCRGDQGHRGAHQSRRQGGGVLGARRSCRRAAPRPAQLEWVHFGCTSEDINNLAYALHAAGRRARACCCRSSTGSAPCSTRWRIAHAGCRMLARTHGQPATPTTVGKEIANVAARLQRSAARSTQSAILGKMERRGRQFQRARRRRCPTSTGRASARRFVESLRPRARTPTPRRSSRTIGSPSTAMPCMRADTVLLDLCARHVGLHLAGLFPAAARRRRSRLLDHAAQGQSRSISRTPRATSGSPTRCSRISPTSCRSRAGSAT